MQDRKSIYGQASGVPSPPPYHRDGAVAARWWGWCWGGQGSHASPTQAINPIRKPMLLFLLTLTCTLNPTPNPKPRLNASSKPKAEHEPSTLTNLALVDRSVIPFNSKPKKTQQLKLNPKPQNPTTTPQGEERPHTPHHRGGGASPIAIPLTFVGGGPRSA